VNFWDRLSTPIILLIGISGFVVYRYRETRAMTLAQFFEMRYSRRYRFFMGALAFVSGMLNYGIFPAISARFFMYFLGLPHHFALGPLQVSTFAAIMFGYLGSCVLILLLGGQVTMMITDCLAGIFSHLAYIVIAVVVFCIVSWSQVMEVMSNAAPGMSPINPTDAGKVQDYNLWFVVMGVITRIYATGASQNRQGFNAAARTAHESRMGGLLGEWRQYARNLMILVLGVCAVAYIHHPAFAVQAKPVTDSLAAIGDPYLRQQMSIPVALSYLLPIGIKGLFVSVMVLGLAGRRQRASAFVGQHLRAGCAPAAEEEVDDARSAHVGPARGGDRRGGLRVHVQRRLDADAVHQPLVADHRRDLHRRRRGVHHRWTVLAPRHHRRRVGGHAHRLHPLAPRDGARQLLEADRLFRRTELRIGGRHAPRQVLVQLPGLRLPRDDRRPSRCTSSSRC
jgi:hypothetical protein